MRAFFSLLLLTLVSSSPAHSGERSESCGGSLWSGYRWCVSVPAGPRSATVVYYFHGHGGKAEGWPGENAALDEQFFSEAGGAPTVISVSFGEHWFLSEVSGLFKAPKLEAFPEILAEAEASLPAPVSSRVLLGQSMGGFNAIQGAAKLSAFFKKTAILCPAQPPLTPFASSSEVEAFIEKGRDYLKPSLVRKWTQYFRKEFTSPGSWEKHNPLELAARIAANDKPIFLQTDDHDIFGFHPNAVKFHEALEKAGAKVDWHVTPNGWHCALTKESTKALTSFLLN